MMGPLVRSRDSTLLATVTSPSRLQPAALAATVLLALALIAWRNHFPQSPMIAAVGLPGATAADAGRRCERWFLLTRWGRLPLREASCRAPSTRQRFEEGYVAFDIWTRRMTHVHRRFGVDDSPHLRHVRDSMVAALKERGAQFVSCARGSSLPHILESSIWRLDGYDVRITGYRMIEPDYHGWFIQVDGFPGAAPECGGTVVRPR